MYILAAIATIVASILGALFVLGFATFVTGSVWIGLFILWLVAIMCLIVSW